MRLSTSSEDVRSTLSHLSHRRPSGTLYLSIVCSTDGARFAAVAETEEVCLAQIASYVAKQTDQELRPSSVQRVRELLAAGETSAAVEEYFRRTGERWDREWLVTTSLNSEPGKAAWSGPIPLPRLVQPDEARPREAIEWRDRTGQAGRIAQRAQELKG